MQIKKQLLLTFSLLLILILQIILAVEYDFFVNFYTQLVPSLTFIISALLLLAISSLVYFFRKENKFFNKTFRILIYILLTIFIYRLLFDFQSYYSLMRVEGESGILLSLYYALRINTINLITIIFAIFSLYAHKSIVGKFNFFKLNL